VRPTTSTSGQPGPGTRGGGDPPRLTWLPAKGADIPTTWAIQGGWEADGQPLYIGRQSFTLNATQGQWGVGRAGVHLPGFCRIQLGTTEQTFNDYHVLASNVDDDEDGFNWVPFSPGQLQPSGPWTVGQTRGDMVILESNSVFWGPLVIIRCALNGAVLVGTGTTTRGNPTGSRAWVGQNGVCHEVTALNCEVLCYGSIWNIHPPAGTAHSPRP